MGIDLKHLGTALLALRKRRRKSQTAVGDLMGDGTKYSTISKWENGRALPTLTSLVRFLEAVDATLCDLDDTLRALGRNPRIRPGEIAELLRRRKQVRDRPELRALLADEVEEAGLPDLQLLVVELREQGLRIEELQREVADLKGTSHGAETRV